MKNNTILDYNAVDKASYLRSQDIFNHKDFNIKKLRLSIIWDNKFPVNIINENNFSALWVSGEIAMDLIKESNSLIFLGILKELFYFSININHIPKNKDQYYDLRAINPLLNNFDLTLLTTSKGINNWHNKNIFCSICGQKNKNDDYGNSRICVEDNCKSKIFPRLDPAVIMLITYKNFCLLGRQKIWPKGMHSTLAGFVEHGETIEQAVERETFEETGVKIKNITYKYSQPWPFPSSLMLGFHAEAIEQKLNIDYSEIENAKWFSKDFLKSSPENQEFKMPGKISIARRLIQEWLK